MSNRRADPPYLNGAGPGNQPLAGNYGNPGTQPGEDFFRKIREDNARSNASLKAYGRRDCPVATADAPPAPHYATDMEKIQAGYSGQGGGPGRERLADGRVMTPSEQAIVDNARLELARRKRETCQ